jgi:hypothetical protein
MGKKTLGNAGAKVYNQMLVKTLQDSIETIVDTFDINLPEFFSL